MVEHMQFAAVTLMTLMAVALAVWMPRRVSGDRVVNRSRWLMVAGLVLISTQFLVQFIFGFRAMGVTQGVFVNILFFIPCSWLIALSLLNLQRQGRLSRTEWMAGPVTLAVAATVMLLGGSIDEAEGLLSDTPKMRNAEWMASICYGVMQLMFTWRHVVELRRMRQALSNYYDQQGPSLRWLFYSIIALSILALMIPVLIYTSGLPLSVYALFCFISIFYMWFQFVGFIRTSAALRMREAEESEETSVKSEKLTDTTEAASSKDLAHVAEAAERWIADGRHLRTGIVIKTAAQEMGIAREQFTAWLATTPQKEYRPWITYHRIEAAKRMMQQHPDWSNETVAQQCGFSTRNYFQEVFKKQEGMTPSRYQQNLQMHTD